MPPQTDTEALRNALTREVTNDAYAISNQIFKGQEPDVARQTNEQVDQRYQQAINTGDRQYLMSEASRDPAQFMASMQRLIDAGQAYMPPGTQLERQPKLPQAAKPDVPLPSAPEQAFPQALEAGAPVPSAPGPAAAQPPIAPPLAPPTITPGTVPNVTSNVPPPPAGTGFTTG